MIGACRLNNKSMRNIRRNEVYQCLAIDLAMLGVISKEECEMLIGSGIPKGLVLPSGKQGEFVSEKNLPKQPDFIKTETSETSDTEQTPVQPEPVLGIIVDTEQTGTQDTGDETGNTETGDTDIQPEPIPGVTVMPGDETPETVSDDETQEPVNDEGRTESDN